MPTNPNPSSNLFLFYGEDDFSLKRKLDHWKVEFAKKYSPQAVIFLDASELSETQLIQTLQQELTPSLFASKKLLIIRDALPKKAEPAYAEASAGRQEKLCERLLDLPNTAPKDYFIVFWQTTKPDGRLKFTKQFKTLVNVTEFELPHGLLLNQWIQAMSKTLGVAITDRAADRLAQFLGRDLFEEKRVGGRVVDRKEAFDLWQVYSELLKLASNTDNIDIEQVNQLVQPKTSDSVFALTDQMIAKNQKGTFEALENFLATSTTEEKTTFIKIIGLLSDQLRSLLVVGLLQKQSLSNDQIADKLGWSSGRVFITAKNLRAVSIPKLKSLLFELLTIDYRIKSSDANVKLDLDLFLTKATI